MYKYADEGFHDWLVKSFQKDINKDNLLELDKKISELCNIKKLFSKSEFETNERDKFKKLQDDIKIYKKLDIKNNIANDYFVNFCNDVIEMDVILSQINTEEKFDNYEIKYLKTLKKSLISKHCMADIIKVSNKLANLESKIKNNSFKREYCNKMSDQSKMMFTNNYLRLLERIINEKANQNIDLNELSCEFGTAVDCFLLKKIAFVIHTQLDMIDKDFLLEIIKSNEIINKLLKNNIDKLRDMV